MKNLFLTSVLLVTLISFISCNNEVNDLPNNSEMNINNEDTPLFGNSKSKAQIINDFSRESILDTSVGQLKVPVIFVNGNIQNKNAAPDVKFRIATRKSGCKRGIGFRCGNDLPKLKTSDSELDDERTFDAVVKYDYDNGYVIYQFNEIDWDEL